jgi:hypothetical protein
VIRFCQRNKSEKLPKVFVGILGIIVIRRKNEIHEIMLHFIYLDYLRKYVMKKEETYLGEIHEKYEISLNSEMKASYRRDFAQYVIDKERQNGRVIETDGRAVSTYNQWPGRALTLCP